MDTALIGSDSSLFETAAYRSALTEMSAPKDEPVEDEADARDHVDDLMESLSLICEDDATPAEMEKRLQSSPYFAALQGILNKHKETIPLPSERFEIAKLQAQSRVLDRSVHECVTTMMKTEKDETDPSTMNACRSVNRAFQKLPEHLAQLHSNVWTNRPVLNQLLQRHARVRPITPTDVSNAESTLLTCELHHGNQIKTDICNYSMIATSLFLRRQRRRNFPKKATQILNAYFEAHMDDPYPSDETKERLAKECGVTVAQVSNWFGNRRIRFKKSLTNKQQPAKTRRNARSRQ